MTWQFIPGNAGRPACMLSARKQPTAAHERRRRFIACTGGQSVRATRAACCDLLLRRDRAPLPLYVCSMAHAHVHTQGVTTHYWSHGASSDE